MKTRIFDGTRSEKVSTSLTGTTLVLLLTLLTSSYGTAQTPEYVFKVLSVNGKVRLNKKDATEGAELKDKKDQIRLSENASAKLMHWTGKTLNLQKPGTYTLVDVLNEMNYPEPSKFVFRIAEKKGDVRVNGEKTASGMFLYSGDIVTIRANSSMLAMHSSGKYADITEPGEYTIEDMLKVLTSKKPPVLATTLKFKKDEGPFLIDLVRNEENDKPLKIMFAPVTFFWCINRTEKLESDFLYRVTIQSMFDDSLSTWTTKENYVAIDLSVESYAPENAIIIKVELIKNGVMLHRAKPLAVQRINSEEKMSDEERALRSKLTTDSNVHQFWNEVATECQSKGFYFNALHALNKAWEISGQQKYRNKINALVAEKFGKSGKLHCLE